MAGMRDDNEQLISEFRSNSGNTVGRFQGKPLLLLTTIGAKSGVNRTVPLVYLADGNRYIVFASKGGSPSNPDWFHNIKANSTVSVELGGKTFIAVASILAGSERDSLYDKQVHVEPVFGRYQDNTSRVIPVIALTISE